MDKWVGLYRAVVGTTPPTSDLGVVLWPNLAQMMPSTVTWVQLGEDTNSPLFQFPRCCEHLTSSLDPEVHAIATPPVLCWLCGAGFSSKNALYRHARAAHGDYAEYRKHLFWQAQERGFLPLLPWQKRHMLMNFSFFECFSIPGRGATGWTE